jgi:hypothetical protein
MDSPQLSQASKQKCSEPNQRQIIYYCQVVAIYIIVVACIVNLSLGGDKDTVWASMLSASIGYLLPSPKFKRIKNDAFLHDDAQQQLSSILPRQHDDGLYDQTSVDGGTDGRMARGHLGNNASKKLEYPS